jgi:hypothetical protein
MIPLTFPPALSRPLITPLILVFFFRSLCALGWLVPCKGRSFENREGTHRFVPHERETIVLASSEFAKLLSSVVTVLMRVSNVKERPMALR